MKLRVGNIETTRLASPFDVYRLQAAQAIFNEEKENVSDFCNKIGGTKLLSTQLQGYTLQRKNNILHLCKT